MLRTQISLTNEERRLLDVASARTGRSISALIRDAVDAVYGAQDTAEADLAGMRRAFGSWSADGPGGAQLVEQLRSGGRLDNR